MKNISLRIALLTTLVAIGAIASCDRSPQDIKPTKNTIPDYATSTVKSADGIPISYDVSGDGEISLVFVHCWSCNRSFWNKQFGQFAKKYKVVRLDLAGHGTSGSGRDVYTMPAFGEDVAAVVNKLNLHNVILIGHSMGGPVIIEAAKQLGDRVTGIVGVDTFYTGFPYPKGEKIAEFVKPYEEGFATATSALVRSMFTKEANPVLVKSIVESLSTANKDVGISAMYEVFRWTENESTTALQSVGSKLRNINADPKGDGKPLNESIVLISSVGHFIAQVKPEEFNKSLENIIVGF